MRKKTNVSDVVKSWYRDRNRWTEATWDLEFKSGMGGLPKNLWETYSAFANTNGGVIVVGADNNGVLEDIKTAEKYREEFTSILSAGTKCSTVMCGEDDVAIVEISGKEVLAIRVKAATAAQKPVYLDGKPMKCYIRVGEGDRRCTAAEVSRMLRDKDVVTSQYSADADIIPHSGPEDLDAETLLLYRENLRNNRRLHPWAVLDDEGLLIKLGAYRRDRQTGEKGLTLAGLLMFGRAETIRELHPLFRIDYFELDGSEKTCSRKRWIDRVTNDGTWASNLYMFYQKVLHLLVADLKRPFRIGRDLMRKDYSTAYEAVQEALANAIIHADYRDAGGVKIIKSPKGLVLENAGTLLMSKEEVYAGGNSLCRNKNLQTMFKLIGIVDEAGTGVDVLMSGWTENFLCLPYVEEDRASYKVTWSLPYLAMLKKNAIHVLQEFMGYEKYARLSAREKILLLMIPPDRFVSNQELRVYLSSIHAVDLGKMLAHLRDEGYLLSKGRSSATKYGLSEKIAEKIKLLEVGVGADLATNVGTDLTTNVGTDLTTNVGTDLTTNVGTDLTTNVGTDLTTNVGRLAVAATDSSFEGVVKGLSLSSSLLQEIEEYRKRDRNARHVTDDLIVSICHGRRVTLLQLSILLNRETEPLRRDFVAPLVRHGKLQFTEEIKHSAEQAYTTVITAE